ncbi:DNA polymerase III subunit gamma/tau [Priestia endophytica]|uniref:DNA polymerase III subunit gamma/tau n=1 Tax=Priestia endophytica TaxID=135735 RepID=UPI003D2B02F7
MAYQALYRVYRPQSFEDVVGQKHIVKTLKNALLQQKFSHAYLFSGPRGTGKTTAAKILSKAVNCEHAPVSEPCNECAACRGIMDGSISDVIEIDAASNNGVDEIRDIRDKVKYAPSAVRYKVYIIDEVHMLSIGAFNALLKTLEEPPPHVIFILATTEPHKIPLTIISRCQRFDFKRITSDEIVYRMKKILEDQNTPVEDEALYAVARAADGGMRDALSLLDQAISYSDEKVNIDDVLSITGAVSQQFLEEVVEAIAEREVSKALTNVNEIVQNGKDPVRFIEDLIFYYRDLLLYKTGIHNQDLLQRAVIHDGFISLSESVQGAEIHEIIRSLNGVQQEMKWTNHPRVLLEVALVKLCQQNRQKESSGDVEELLQKVQLLEEQLSKIQEQGVVIRESEEAAKPKENVPRSSKQQYKAPTGRINEVLKKATKKELEKIKQNWAEVLDMLRKQNKASHAALLANSEPVASSSDAFVLKFKYEIHCKMVAENNNSVRDYVETILHSLIGQKVDLISIPESQWESIRENFIREHRDEQEQPEETDDPLISEAKRLFGDELVEIQD